MGPELIIIKWSYTVTPIMRVVTPHVLREKTGCFKNLESMLGFFGRHLTEASAEISHRIPMIQLFLWTCGFNSFEIPWDYLGIMIMVVTVSLL